MIETLPALADTMTLATAMEVDPEEIAFPEGSFIAGLRDWSESLPEALQWLAIIAISAIPFMESFVGGFIGVVIGLPFWAALLTAVIGNMLALLILIYGAHFIRTQILKRQEPKELSLTRQKRREKAKRLFDKFGVPGVSLLGPIALPSQFTAPLMVSFGANRHAVTLWMFVSVVVWGAGFTLLGVGFLNIMAA